MGIDYTKPVRTDEGVGFEYAPDHISRDNVAPRTAVLGMATPALLVMVALLTIMLVGCKGESSKRDTRNDAAPIATSSGLVGKNHICRKNFGTGKDLTLCLAVHGQHAYGVVLPKGGSWSAPAGPAIVKDIVSQGLTKGEMRSYLKGEALNYRQNVTGVTVNMDKLKSSDCQWIIEFNDEDRKPGGRKLTRVWENCA
jgi:hypothetical protein